MFQIKTALVSALVFCFAQISVAEIRQTSKEKIIEHKEEPDLLSTCEWFTKSKPWAYCITRQKGSQNPDILWYIHGAGGNEKKWFNVRRNIRDIWRARNVDMPTVITVSFGPVWLLAEKADHSTSGLFEYFTQTVIPMLENKVGGLRGERLAFSVSMGGFNTSQIVMKRKDIFARAVIACPAITPFSPYDKTKVFMDFISRTGASKNSVFWTIVMQRVFYKDTASWNADSPLILGQTKLGPDSPQLLVTCGKKDRFGFFEGARQFAQLAHSRGVRVSWEERDGDHCSYNPQSVADFLVR